MDNQAKLLETLKQWSDAKKALEQFKVLENNLRTSLVSLAYPNKKALAEGTFKFELPHGWELSIAAKVNITIDEAALDTLYKQLRELQVKPEDIFGSKPTFIKKGYKALTAEHKKIVDTVLTFKDGAPTLDLIAPKQPKA